MPTAFVGFAFTIRFSESSPDLVSDVGVMPFLPEAKDKSTPTIFKALWDTGASATSISNRLVNKLGLKPISKARVLHAGGEHIKDAYMVAVHLPNATTVLHLEAVEFDAPDMFDVLIGMDIILLGDFAVTNHGGQTVFSFCIPSRGHIDFEQKSGLSDSWDAHLTEGG